MQGSLQLIPPEPDLRAVIEEFARLLEVLSGQLEQAMQDASRDSAALAHVFQKIAASNSQVAGIAGRVPDVLRHCADIDTCMNDAVTALQFQDRLAQRAVHVRAGLTHMRTALRQRGERSYEEWLQLLRDVELIQEIEQARLTNHSAQGSAELF
jgi:ABC-type transporter Mla subunit MlaD